jgi:hypothetical protein
MPEKSAAVDKLLERILYDCRMSNGTMPIRIVVADDAEKARGQKLLKGRHHNQRITIATEAEVRAEIAHALRGWKREPHHDR